MQTKQFIKTFSMVAGFSTAIAVLIWWLGIYRGFADILTVSLSIGWSVHLAFELLLKHLSSRLPAWLLPIPIIAIGLSIGLFIAGALVAGKPLLFFSEDYFGTLTLGLFFGITGFVIFGTRERLRQTKMRLASAELQQAQQEKLLAETDLKLMQAQIEPHFLFNTLSNLTQLIRENPDLAIDTLEKLTTLLRSSLARTRTNETTLEQEFEFADAYLAIQATRMQNRLTYRLELPATLRDVRLPPLLLQPLLENAVIHGIEPNPDGGEVVLSVKRVDRQLILRVRDNGVGICEMGTADGTGLRNIRDRLRLAYGSDANLELTPASPRGVTAMINIPIATP